jgi:hypothetical protein
VELSVRVAASGFANVFVSRKSAAPGR